MRRKTYKWFKYFKLMNALQEVTSLTLTPRLTIAPAHTARCTLNTAETRA